MRFARLILLVLILSCVVLACRTASTLNAKALPVNSPSQNCSSSQLRKVPSMSEKPSHLPVCLSLPYYPWTNYYNQVRSDKDMGTYLDQKMIPALEAPGDPAERLKKMAAAAQEARTAVSGASRQVDSTFNGLDPVETDLRVAFMTALSEKIATSEAPPETRLAELRALLAIVRAEPPVGVPEPFEFRPWDATARITAETEIKVHIEALEGSQ